MMRLVLMWTSVGVAAVCLLLAWPLFYSDTDDMAIGAMFAMLLVSVAIIFVFIAFGAWIAERNKAGGRL